MINFRLNSIFSVALCQLLLSFHFKPVGGISDIYLCPFFIWVCIHAHWNNCSPVESRHTEIIIAVISSLFFFFSAGPAFSFTSLLSSQSYVGIKRQRKTITDPLTPISQTLGVWEESTYKPGTDLLIGPQ